MGKKKERISVNAWERIMKEHGFEQTVSVNWYGENLIIKRILPMSDAMQFVREVALSSFTEADDEYIPEVTDFAYKRAMVLYYTNLTLPKNIERCYDLLYTTDIIDIIEENIDQSQSVMMDDAIGKLIEYKANSSTQAMTRRIEETVTKFEGLEQQLNNIFGGVTQEDITMLTGAIANGSFSEEKLAEAMLDRMASPAPANTPETVPLHIVGEDNGG